MPTVRSKDSPELVNTVDWSQNSKLRPSSTSVDRSTRPQPESLFGGAEPVSGTAELISKALPMAGLGVTANWFRHHSVSRINAPEACGAAIEVPLQKAYCPSLPPIAVAQVEAPARRVELTVSPGVEIVGSQRPSTAGPRLEKELIASMLPDTRKVWVLPVTTTFLASFGAVTPDWPELPAENTTMNGSSSDGVSKLPSSTIRS